MNDLYYVSIIHKMLKENGTLKVLTGLATALRRQADEAYQEGAFQFGKDLYKLAQDMMKAERDYTSAMQVRSMRSIA